MVRPRLPILTGLTFLAALLLTAPLSAQHGIVLSGTGPVNRSMGGASTAAPLDASGALYWNPAAIRGLRSSELDVGLELLYPQTRLTSSVSAGTLGRGFPPVGLSGSDRGDDGVAPVPTVGLVVGSQDCSWSYGIGMALVGGFNVNYPASLTNPILTPQPPNGIGLGAKNAELQVWQLTPTVAYQLTDRLAIGIAPTVNLVHLIADPLVIAAPNDANGDGFASYPDGTHSRVHWGLGVQAGVFWSGDDGWSFGASLKSPQWLESFHFQSSDELGRPLGLKARFDYPLIASIGAAYTGMDCWVFAADVRYVDYDNTKGLNQSGFAPNGAALGLGWESIIVVALGAQYQVSERLSLRAGYSYNQNPIDDFNSVFNVSSAVIIEHTAYLGATWHASEALHLSVAYAHGFNNTINGPIRTPLGTVPLSSVQSDTSADTIMMGVSVKF